MHAQPEPFTTSNFERGSGLLLEEARPPMSSGSRPRPAPPGRPPFRVGTLIVWLILLLGVGLVAGLLPRYLHRGEVAADTRELSMPTVTLVTPSPTKGVAPLILSGELRPVMEAPIYARASGYVRRWLVDIGAHVEAGQLMAELETPEIDRELKEDTAQLRQAEAAKALAQTTATRWTQMLGGRTVSPQEAEEKTGDLSVKQAAVEAAAAKVQRLQELAGFAKITAPFAGIVTARNLDIGQLVEAGSARELFRISQTDHLRVYVRVPQSYARSVAEGQRAEIVVPESADRTYEAKVVRSAGAIDAASRTLLTELEVDNANNDLLAGSYAQVRLVEARPAAQLTIPANCLLFRAQGPQVGVVDAAHHVELRGVVIGRDFGMTVEIIKGVEPGEQVILNPPDALVTGVEVRVNPTAPETAPPKS